jgi:hypothetical protein
MICLPLYTSSNPFWGCGGDEFVGRVCIVCGSVETQSRSIVTTKRATSFQENKMLETIQSSCISYRL